MADTWTDEHPTPQQVADLLRTVEFAMGHARTALVAFVPRHELDTVRRDAERLGEALLQVKAMLATLPPAEPLIPEQEARAKAWIARTLERIDP